MLCSFHWWAAALLQLHLSFPSCVAFSPFPLNSAKLGPTISRQRLNLMHILHHFDPLHYLLDCRGAGNEEAHCCWPACPHGCGSWAEMSQRHRTERCVIWVQRGDSSQYPVLAHPWPDQELDSWSILHWMIALWDELQPLWSC